MIHEGLAVTDLVVTRHINASPEAVFDAWLDPKCAASLWEGADQLILDPVESALFYWVVTHEGERWPHYGRFLILDRAAGRIEHTWMSPATKGLETTVAIALVPRDGGTDFRLPHAGVPDDAPGRKHQEGWTMIAGAVAEHLEREPARP